MSKVLVDRELLVRTVKHLEWDGDGSQTVMQYAQQGDSLANELMDCIAQPAEAEGPSFAEVLEQASVIQQLGAKNKRIDELQTALSAVTANLERVEALRDSLANMSDRVISERNQLRAEVDALRKDAERYRWLRDSGGSTFRVLETGALAKGEFYDAAIDAAMAAKEE